MKQQKILIHFLVCFSLLVLSVSVQISTSIAHCTYEMSNLGSCNFYDDLYLYGDLSVWKKIKGLQIHNVTT